MVIRAGDVDFTGLRGGTAVRKTWFKFIDVHDVRPWMIVAADPIGDGSQPFYNFKGALV